ncbi:hypothetical protein VM1G_07208 [Cytospora mali]|uniref:LPXTG-domain-containing protein n=1 Tax=Cytospora mali TaxID=578113 RepID=A0A194W453_CYTMA|nr:hypothetical protein VM1G_07208 [Valsa mali]
MRRAITTVLITASTLIPNITALQVTPGSSCASVCLDSEAGNALDPAASTTNTSDIVCYDVDYYSTTVGVKFKNCLECLQNSTDASGSESDVSWFLYNLRYASAVCLYDYPALQANKSETCDLSTACQPLQGAIETGLDLDSDSGDFAYCSTDDSVFYGTGIDECVSCLQSSPDSYLANFLIALQAGCQQQPAAGTLLGLSGELFSGYPMNITSLLASNSSTSTTRKTQKEVLSVGAVVGIVIGAAALFILAMVLFYIYWRRQQEFYKEEVAMAHPSVFYGKDQGSGSYMTSLTSGTSTKLVPIYTTDHRAPPPSYAPAGSHGLGTGYTDNAEYYDHMEGRNRSRPIMGTRHQLHSTETSSADHVDVAALPTHPAHIARGHSRLGSRAEGHQRPAPQGPKPGRDVISSRETPLRDIRVELAGPPDAPVPRQDERATPMPSHAFGGRGTPAPVTSWAPSPENGSASRVPSLILPSVPRIRLPGRKLPRLTITSASPEAISGPLAFPDSRFTQGAGDRIVEQTVDRRGTIEVPIGSGKSYLHG